MSFTAAASGFVVFLLSVPVVQGQDDWGMTYISTKICAFKGSTVEMNCTYRYPDRENGLNTTVEKSLWFRKTKDNELVDLKLDLEYAHRVEYHDNQKNCRLRIKDLRESDSAEYKFRFITNQPGGEFTGSPGVSLTVTDLQLQVIRSTVSRSSTRAKLKCRSVCRPAGRLSYIWYKNGETIQGQNSSSYTGNFYPKDSYSCAVNGHEDIRSPSVCVHGQTCNRVTYTDRSICAVKGSSVDISCTYNTYEHDVRSKFWFRFKHRDQWSQPEDLSGDSEFAGRVKLLEESGRSSLRITNLTESDSAEYRFTFKTWNFEWRSSLPGTTLTVTDPDLQVQVIRSTVHLFSIGAELKCHSICSLAGHPSYIWYKNGQKIEEVTSSSYTDNFNPKDSYSCAVKGHEDFHSPSVCVHGQTCNRVTYTDRSICAVKGSSVDISCTYNTYEYYIRSKFWFSPKHSDRWQDSSRPEDLSGDSEFAGRVDLLEESGRSTLRITNLTESDSAEYRFKFKIWNFEWGSSLPGTTLTVTDLQLQVIRSTVHQNHTEAELKCHSVCRPADRPSYIWYKNGLNVPEGTSSSYPVNIYPEDSYSCALKGHAGFPSPSVYAPKVPSVLVSPSGEIVEGSSVTLTCSSDANPAANYTWYKKNGNPDQNPFSPGPQLDFVSIQSSDSGEFYCTAQNELGKKRSDSISVHVKYGPKMTSVSVNPSGEIVEGSSVTLTCSSDANPPVDKYTWYKENQTLLQGPEGSYNFTSISSEDRGTYHCQSENQYGHSDSSSVFIDVQYAPKVPSVLVSPSGEIVEGSSVTLTCSSDANPAANYTWSKKNGNPNQNPFSPGPQLDFVSIQSSDSGEFYCTAQNELGKKRSDSISIPVKYGPKMTSVSVNPSGEIVEGSSVTLTCSSDANPPVDKYTWYKENQTLLQGPEGSYNFTSISSEDSGTYHCQSENQYGHSDSSSVFIDVQYAPKVPSVLVNPSGEIVEGSSVNLTCSSDANPAANYTWYKKNEASPKASGQTFTITDITSEHSGIYYCEAQNRRGRQNSTLQLTVVAAAWKSTAAIVIPAVLLAVILLFVFLWISRRKRTSKQPSEPGARPDNSLQLSPVCDNTPAAAERQPTEQQRELHYASVHFPENQADPLYSNIKTPRPQRQEEEGAQYAAVNFKRAKTAAGNRNQKAVEDPSQMYSKVRKPNKNKRA